ncbi:MAG: VCBS repeat-containing protein [Planctomycetes bacterium]|nr:VCBS repeat-containing protein [Planctomycetota bacterium]
MRSSYLFALIIVVLIPTSVRGECTPLFSTAATYSTASNPRDVAIGDLNGDGRPDLVAVATVGGEDIFVLLNNGGGTFQPAVNYIAGAGPISVVISELNGDGWPDLAAANRFGADVSILLGNGDGTFQPANNYSAGSDPTWVAIGDMNGDGRLDLVVTNLTANQISVLLGNGNGTFQLPVPYAVGTFPISVAMGDLNGDPWPDLAVANLSTNNVSVLLNNGNGTFTPAPNSPVSVGTSPLSVAMGDLDGDGQRDLVVANSGSNNVSVLLGLAGGKFQAAVNYTGVNAPYDVAIGDINGDSRVDLAVANYSNGNPSNVSVFRGNGCGTFQPRVNFDAGNGPASVAISDLNGDGRTDMAVANSTSPNVSVLWNTSSSIGFTQQPASQFVTVGQSAAFSVIVTGTGPLSYQWCRNGTALTNGVLFSGVTTSTLTVTSATAAEVGAYDVRITGGCNGTIGATSNPAVLNVRPCHGDFNGDNLFDSLDIQPIVDALLAGEMCP